ncbi:MAG: DUF4250 domain-containing protein [Mobilitalea sp.]
MSIPSDPFILLSYINTKLRDEFPSLADLCSELNLVQSELESKLSALDYHYNQKLNRFTDAV